MSKALQRMLGHAEASMPLYVYADLFDEDLDSVAANLDAAIRSAYSSVDWLQLHACVRTLGGLGGLGPFEGQPIDAMYERRMQHLWFGGYLDVGHPIA